MAPSKHYAAFTIFLPTTQSMDAHITMRGLAAVAGRLRCKEYYCQLKRFCLHYNEATHNITLDNSPCLSHWEARGLLTWTEKASDWRQGLQRGVGKGRGRHGSVPSYPCADWSRVFILYLLIILIIITIMIMNNDAIHFNVSTNI